MDSDLRAVATAYQEAVECANDGIFLVDCSGAAPRLVVANAACEYALGVHRSALVDKDLAQVLPAELGGEFLRHLRRCQDTGRPVSYDGTLQQGQHRRVFNATIVPVYDDQGQIYRVAGIARDVTLRRAAEDVLRERAEEMSAMVENSPDHVARFDRLGRVVYMNPGMLRALGVRRHQVAGRSVSHLLESHPWLDAYQGALWRVIATGEPAEFDVASRGSAGNRHAHIHMVPESDGQGRVSGVIAIGRDFTHQKQLERELQLREAAFRELVENSPDTIARYDARLQRVYANPRMVALAGGDAAALLGKRPTEFPGGAAAREYEDALHAVFQDGLERDVELRWQVGEREICSHVRMRPEFDLMGNVVHVLAVGRDITEIDEYRRTVHRQAFYDALTGLPNRALLSLRISEAICAPDNQHFGLMMLDLDHFKEVNDSLGHAAGDQLLCEVGRRLQHSVRGVDTVARLGGDEFAMLLRMRRDSGHLGKVAAKLLAALNQPFLIDGHELFISGSIGIATYPDDCSDIGALYKYADSAMYLAKRQGRNHFQFYSRELTLQAAKRVELETALHKARRNGELELYFQPQVDMHSGQLVGAEALLRWNRPGHGLVPPNVFVPVAESSGLIVDIGDWVLAQACDCAARWNAGRAHPVQLSVNLSTRQFQRNDLVGALRRHLMRSGCLPGWLKLEITESLLLEDSKEVADMLADLVDMGMTVSIDDFGTGYSALSYLHRFPVSQIKIDRSFVCDVPGDRSKSELVKAMLSIASALHLQTVAEGVETAAQASYLSLHGCHLAQGYLYGQAMPFEAFDARLAAARA